MSHSCGIGAAWRDHVHSLLAHGDEVSPRGKRCRELLDVAVTVDNSRRCVLTGLRKPNYRFMVAEWLWIAFGRSDLKTVAHFNSRMSEFSDDGVVLSGAYGPPVAAQWDRVAGLLERDRDTRQAVVSIYRPVGDSKDVPCTIALQFLLRFGKLNCVATMRSSDVWLGLPYDVFTFSQLQAQMAGRVGAEPGWLTVRAGSSHIYEEHWEAAKLLLAGHGGAGDVRLPPLPGDPPQWLEWVLAPWETPPELKRDGSEGPWLAYADALAAPTSAAALELLS